MNLNFTPSSSWIRFGHSINQHITLSRKEVLILFAVIAIASFVRFWDLGQVGFRSDEAVYAGQAATLAGYEQFGEHFSIYRAHPLLLQFVVSIVYAIFGVYDTAARVVPAIFGVMTVIVTYFIGKLLYSREAGIVAASVLAILPYHVIWTRQVMVDVPFSFFFTLTLFFMIKYIRTDNRIWVYAIGASSGLSFLSKEVGILTLLASIIYLVYAKKIGIKNIALILASFSLAISPHLILILTREEAMEAASLYSEWQLGRGAGSQPITYHLNNLTQKAFGYVLSALILASIVYALKTRTIRETRVSILLTWIAVPFVFLMLSPLKMVHYLILLLPASIVFGTSFLFSTWIKKIPYSQIIAIVFIPLIALSSSYTASYLLFPGEWIEMVLRSDGTPDVRRAAALWIDRNLPEDAVFMTMETPMANVIKFYSNRDALSMGVDPVSHNPAYTPILSADLNILTGHIDYLIYDITTLAQPEILQKRTEELVSYISKHDAIPIHTEYATNKTTDGKVITKPAIIIYRTDSAQDGKR